MSGNQAEWADTLRAIAASVNERTPDRSPTDGLPFAELLESVVRLARRRLDARCGHDGALLSAKAHRALDDWIRRRLTDIWGATLYFEFALRRGLKSEPLFGIAPPDPARGQLEYARFIADVRASGLRLLVDRYPVLGRLVATTVAAWVETNAELLRRLSTDGRLLAEQFRGGADIGQVESLEAGLSDCHNFGRSVCALSFANGLRIIYKPRDVGIEAAFQRVLAWSNDQRLPLSLKTLRVVLRRTYGWVEAVTQSPCADEAAAERFYIRAGMLLAWLYVLGGTDGNSENLVAAGEHPVLVDLEAALQPQIRVHHAGDRHVAAMEDHAWRSVGRTGLTPRSERGPDGRGLYDPAGLGVPRHDAQFPVPAWQDVDTDAMLLRRRFAKPRRGRNVPSVGSRVLEADDYVGQIVDGFRQMYGCVATRRDELLAPDGVIDPLKGEKIRVIFRSTRDYVSMQKRVLSTPSALRSEADTMNELQVALGRDSADSGHAQLARAELAALHHLDVPRFEVRAAEMEVSLPDNVRVSLWPRSAYAELAAQFGRLGEDDLNEQLFYLRGSYHAAAARQSGPSAAEPAPSRAGTSPARDARECAASIARTLLRHAIRLDDGSCSWWGVERVPQSDRLDLALLAPGLYGGTGGIALFLAAAASTTGDADARAAALASLEPLRCVLREGEPAARRFPDTASIGLADGFASAVYCLLAAGSLLADETLVDDAREFAAFIEPSRIESDTWYDLLYGSAGAIMALLAVHDRTGDRRVLELAQHCGDHLLTSRVSTGNSASVWPSFGATSPTPLADFAHGAAGIGCALGRLALATGDARCRDAALEAFASAESSSQMNAWCHGRSGIALGQLGSRLALDRNARDIVEETVNAIGARPDGSTASVCCGTFGRLETLIVASKCLDRPDLLDTARLMANEATATAEAEGGFRLLPHLAPAADAHAPSFFLGLAGVGYQLLRLAHPDRIPSVLLFDV